MKTCWHWQSLCGAMITFSFMSLPAFAATDNGTLTSGGSSFGPCGEFQTVGDGYYSSLMGSYSPTELTGGNTLFGIYDVIRPGCTNPGNSSIIVSGFSSNPGSSWLTSVTCNGVENTAGSASFTYSSGQAIWSWSKLFGFSGSGNYSCSIVHVE